MKYFLRHFRDIRIVEDKLSESTKVGKDTWGSLKDTAMQLEFQISKKFMALAEEEKETLTRLIDIQKKVGLDGNGQWNEIEGVPQDTRWKLIYEDKKAKKDDINASIVVEDEDEKME